MKVYILAVLFSLRLQLIHLHAFHLELQIIASDDTKCSNTAIHVFLLRLKAVTPLCLYGDSAEQCPLHWGCVTTSPCQIAPCFPCMVICAETSPAALLWDMTPVRLEPKGNYLQAATLWKVHPGKHVLEISELKCLYRCVGTVYGATESLNTSCAPSHSMAQWLAGTHRGGVRVGVWKWRNIRCKSCKFTHGNLPFPTVDKTRFLYLVIYSMMPHLLELGRYYVERPGRARKCIKGVAGSPYRMCWNVPRLAFGVGHHDLRQ